jgi:ABC-type glycerol-3-phosphate transport system substrate-binding protein
MKIRSRAVIAAASAAAVLLAVAGCSGGGGNSSGKTTVTFMTWESADTNKLIDAAVAKWSDKSIEIKRLDTPSGNYSDKLSSLTQAKKLPDVFWCGNDTEQQYSSLGVLTDWSKKMGGDFAASDFGGLDRWTTDKGLGGVPSLRNVYGIWYNEDAFTKAGIDIPKAGWTYDEMYAAADKLKGYNGGKYGLEADGMTSTDSPFLMSNYSVSAGGKPFTDDVNNPTTVQAGPEFTEGVQKLSAAIQNGSMTPPGYDGSNATALFESGKLPMLMGGQWLAASFINDKPAIKWGWAPMPVVDKQVVTYDAIGMCTPKTTANADATFKVVKFLDSTVMKEVMAKTPVAPPAYQPAQSAYFESLTAANATTVADTAKYNLDAKTTVGTRFTTTWATQAADLTTAEYLPILQGKAPISGLKDYVAKVKALIKN